MSDINDADQALNAAIEDLAKKASSATNHSVALKYASAANQLAEARAWMRSTAQPHGGGMGFGDS